MVNETEKNPLVSVIMNCHNGETYLKESINSLINQTYKNWELIFWDNFSSDSSKEVLTQFSDKRIKYYYAKNFTTLYEARNLATKHIIKLAKKNNFPGVVVRFYQVYGPGQNTNRLIPFVIKSCKNDEKFPCSSGNQTKDFLYVTDAIDAIIKTLESKNCHGEIINIGYGRPVKVKKIILLIRNFVKKGMPQFNKIKLRKDEPLEYYPSIKKAHRIIGWKPKISLSKGIELTI